MKIFKDFLFDRQFDGLQKNLELTWRRNEAITSNIANAETPQYRAVDVNFAHELDRAFGSKQDAVAMTHAGHLDLTTSSSAHIVPTYSGVTKPDGNNVDIDIEMGRLAYNSSKFGMSTNLLRKKFQLLINAIRQGT